VRRSTRRELIVAAGATALSASVPPAWGRLTSRRAGMGKGRFYDGVASGEPSSTAITFWSRIRTEHARSGARLLVATDEGLSDVVATAVVPTGRGVNWALKTRVGGLEPHTEYFYAWQSTNSVSPVGRTRTMPPKDSRTPVKVGYSSCQHFNFGYFSAHQHAAAEELDLYVFLGDYVYERGRIPTGAVRVDRVDAVDLATYRKKWRVYRTDPGLRELHRQHPMVHIWDDHEVFNNYTANNPPPAQSQAWAGYRAAFEWLPRMTFPYDRFRIYKKLSLGAYADLFLLDTRQHRTGYNDGKPLHILDAEQMSWLLNGLKKSKARWKIIANQVVVADDPYNTGESGDKWAAYPADRTQLLSAIEAAGLRDVVFLTGDAHVFMCALVGTDSQAIGTDPSRVPAAVEYVGGAVTSPGQDHPEAEVRANAPWVQQYNGRDRGYSLLGADDTQLITEYRKSDLTTSAGATVAFDRFTQPAGANRVSRESLQPPVEPRSV
jgi:alkaline phosphatase D